MTANQLELQSNLETERHNKVVEKLQADANYNDQQRNEIQDRWNTIQAELEKRRLDIEANYKQGTIAYNNMMAQIARERQDQEYILSIDANAIKSEANRIQKDRITEDLLYRDMMQRYNNALLGLKTNELSVHQAEVISNLKLGYANLQLQAQTNLANLKQKERELAERYYKDTGSFLLNAMDMVTDMMTLHK